METPLESSRGLPGDFWLLRWRFYFQGGASCYGMWNQSGNVEESGAWKQSRGSRVLQRAAIEGKHNIGPRVTRVMVDVPGQDFVMFQWLALARLPFKLRGSMIPKTTLGGLQLVTYEEIITVHISGLVRTEPRPDAHKVIGFATYGK